MAATVSVFGPSGCAGSVNGFPHAMLPPLSAQTYVPTPNGWVVEKLKLGTVFTTLFWTGPPVSVVSGGVWS